MSPVNAVTIAGSALDLDAVEYSVSVSHGRNDVTAQPEASSVQLNIRGLAGVQAEISDSLTVDAYGRRRFTGQITDITITHLPNPAGDPVAVTTIIAMGNLSKLGLINVGANGFPEQDVQNRAQEILTEIGLPSLNNTDSDIVLEAVPATDFTQTAYDALRDLCESTGATFSDLPNGFISFESYGQRGIRYQEGSWGGSQFPWDNYDPALEWGDVPTGDPVTQQFTEIPPGTVTFTPTWSARLQPIINRVTVSYGASDPQDTVMVSDTASIARYGLREYVIETGIKDVLDATDRAAAIITAQANPLYSLQQISVLVHELTDIQRAEVLAIVEGYRVILTDLPMPNPAGQFQGIVEGWSETYTPGQHILTLSISDPRYSYQTVAWGDVDPALEWGDVDPAIQWFNVLTSDDLAA